MQVARDGVAIVGFLSVKRGLAGVFGCFWWNASVTAGVVEWWNLSDVRVWLVVVTVVNLVY